MIVKARVPASRLAANAAAGRRTLILGKKPFTAERGATATVTVRLSKLTAKLLQRRKRPRRAEIIVRASDEIGRLPVAAKTVKLKALKQVSRS